jgi:pimeloyl-ACP methyl ester carboxylesterase
MMRDGFVNLGAPFGDLRLHYTDWGDQAASRVAVCVHGLTRNARDFDVLASALADAGARVVCVDVAGRGGSDRLADPADYRVDVYAGHLARFLELLDLRRVAWVGTSMGGLIGMALAAAGERSPVDRLVLNDIGPFVPKAALEPIRATSAWTCCSPTSRRWRATSARSTPPSARSPTSSGPTWRATAPASCPRASACTTTPRSGHPSPTRRPRTSRSGGSTTRSPARPWCCAAATAACSPPRRPMR